MTTIKYRISWVSKITNHKDNGEWFSESNYNMLKEWVNECNKKHKVIEHHIESNLK